MILGAHVSIAGGVSNAPLYGKEAGCDSIQIFTKNQMQWKTPPLTDDEVLRFRENIRLTNIVPAVVHSSYLVNAASPDKEIYERSITALAVELERAEKLCIPMVVFHPGAHKGNGEGYALKRIAKGIKKIFKISKSENTKLILVTTAGEGTTMGYTFEHFARIFDTLGETKRLGICIDTCHIFAAGYDLRGEDSYKRTFDEVEYLIGIDSVKLFHLNDSKCEMGSRMDRHAEIGSGKIGLKAFSLFVNDERFRNIPGILEIPGDITGYRRNLNILRSLINSGTDK